MTTPPRALHICYSGLREPLVQTQVLPYLRQLVTNGVEMSLLTFEPELKAWNRDSIDDWHRRLQADGIDWHVLPYHKRPSLPATLYDIVAGAFRARSIARREGITLFHGRSHVGAAIGVLAKWRTGARLIFDFRGFLADEYDIALAVIRPSYARRSMSPAKFAEYLAAGLPVIASAGIGDLDTHIDEARAGVLLKSLDRRAYAEAFSAMAALRRDPELTTRCRNQARERYDLRTVGGEGYRRLYREVLAAPDRAS